MPRAASCKQVNIRVEDRLYEAIEAVARRERRSVPQAARLLLEEGLRVRTAPYIHDDIGAAHIAELAVDGRSFDWLAEEPDLYDETAGEPV